MLLPAKPPAPAPDPHPAGSADRRGAAIAGTDADRGTLPASDCAPRDPPPPLPDMPPPPW